MRLKLPQSNMAGMFVALCASIRDELVCERVVEGGGIYLTIIAGPIDSKASIAFAVLEGCNQ